MDSIFDLEDISDCPQELQDDIRPRRNYNSNLQYKDVYALFLIKDMLTLDEVQVGYYRKYGVYMNRAKLLGSINLLKRNKHSIIRLRQGVYLRKAANMGAKK